MLPGEMSLAMVVVLAVVYALLPHHECWEQRWRRLESESSDRFVVVVVHEAVVQCHALPSRPGDRTRIIWNTSGRP